MRVNIEEEKFLHNNKVVLSVSLNRRQWTALPSMTMDELTEIRDEINKFLSKSEEINTIIPKNIPSDNIPEVKSIINHILSCFERGVCTDISISKYNADSALIAAKSFKEAGYFVYVSRSRITHAIYAYQIYKRDVYPNAKKL